MRLVTPRILQDYIELNEEIERLEKRKKQFREALIEAGDVETRDFISKVDEIRREQSVSPDEIREKIGEAKAKKLGLIKRIKYTKLTVKRKAA